MVPQNNTDLHVRLSIAALVATITNSDQALQPACIVEGFSQQHVLLLHSNKGPLEELDDYSFKRAFLGASKVKNRAASPNNNT
jgi:hypothetical protein